MTSPEIFEATDFDKNSFLNLEAIRVIFQSEILAILTCFRIVTKKEYLCNHRQLSRIKGINIKGENLKHHQSVIGLN